MAYRIDALRAPLLVTWQLTRDCDLACLHCCTESAPGKRLPDELTREEALRFVADIVACEVPYVMLCGGEPMVSPHFPEIAEDLGDFEEMGRDHRLAAAEHHVRNLACHDVGDEAKGLFSREFVRQALARRGLGAAVQA